MSFHCLSAPRIIATLLKMMACVVLQTLQLKITGEEKTKKKKEKKVRRRWNEEAEM